MDDIVAGWKEPEQTLLRYLNGIAGVKYPVPGTARPCRYTITRDGYVVLASETGVLEFPGSRILRRGRPQPGRMFLVDLEENRVVPDNEIKAKISRQKPYRRWVKDNRIELRGLFTPPQAAKT